MKPNNEKRAIYSLSPISNHKDHYRLVEYFDTERDAKLVLAFLEFVNINFNCYKLLPLTKNSFTKGRTDENVGDKR